MSRDAPHFDSIHALTQYGHLLDAVSVRDDECEVFYEIMSGALIWRDEIPVNSPTHLAWALRSLFAYRTSLMLEAPRHEFAPLWNQALLLAPNWIGFLRERRTPTDKLLKIHRRGDLSLRKCIRDMERGKVSPEDLLYGNPNPD